MTMKALRQHALWKPLQVEDIPIPTAGPGSGVIRVLATSIISYTRDIYDGTRKYQYVTPLTVGSNAIGRVHAVGPDATSLKEGQLVLFDITVRSRDDASHIFLSAITQGFSEGSAMLMRHWTDGSYAEYLKAPLENLFPIDEARLCGELEYTCSELLSMTRMLVPWGGLLDIDLRAGETIVVAPATGSFGTAAVHLALAMGARVIAMGRNTDILARHKQTLATQYPADRFLTVTITGDEEKETVALREAAGNRPIDAFYDISPDAGRNGSYFKAAIMSLGHAGRVSLMGGQRGDVSIPYHRVMHSNLLLKGTWMYQRQDVPKFIRLVENGNLVLGRRAGMEAPKEFELGQWKEAFDYAAENTLGAGAVFIPAGNEV